MLGPGRWIGKKSEDLGLTCVKVHRGRTESRSIEGYKVKASLQRPTGLSQQIPFIRNVPCVACISTLGGSATWPASPAEDPELVEMLRGLIPPDYVDIRHPRRILPILCALESELSQRYPGDSRIGALAELIELSASRSRPVGESIPADHWFSEELMQSFWAIYDTIGMPTDLVERLEVGFGEIDRQLLAEGWLCSDRYPGSTSVAPRPDPRRLWIVPRDSSFGPSFYRDRVNYYRKESSSAELAKRSHGTGYRNLELSWWCDA